MRLWSNSPAARQWSSTCPWNLTNEESRYTHVHDTLITKYTYTVLHTVWVNVMHAQYDYCTHRSAETWLHTHTASSHASLFPAFLWYMLNNESLGMGLGWGYYILHNMYYIYVHTNFSNLTYWETIFTHTHTCTLYTHQHMHARMHTNTCAHTHVHTHACTHTHHTCTHTYTHACTHTQTHTGK